MVMSFMSFGKRGGGESMVSSVSSARDCRSGDCGFDPRYGLLLLTDRFGVSIMCPAEFEVVVLPLCLCVGKRQHVRHQSWDQF